MQYLQLWKRNLKRHIESVHEGIKPFKCNICDYETAQKGHLKKHKDSVHEGIKPYKCHICQFESATSSHVKRHITVVHEKKKNKINASKSVGHCSDQELSFQYIKNEPSETVDPLLIHEFKEVFPVYIKQEKFGAFGCQNELEN